MDITGLAYMKGFEPKFDYGQQVFVMVGGKRGYVSDVISSICFKTHINETGKCELYTLGYETNSSFLFKDNGIFVPEDVTTDEAFAKHEMEFIEAHFEEAEWQLAIGDRGYDPGFVDLAEPGDYKERIPIEDSELGICCEEISDIRDLLLKCKEQSGLNKRQIRNLAALLLAHEVSVEQRYLGKILDTLGINYPTAKDG